MRLALYVLLITLAHASTAHAGALDIADRHWGPHPCAGQVQIVYDPTLTLRNAVGEAIGLRPVWDGNTWHWYTASCTISVLPGLEPSHKCHVVVHEIGHLIWGAEHDGPMHPDNLNIDECWPSVTHRTPRQHTRATLRRCTRLATPASATARSTRRASSRRSSWCSASRPGWRGR